MKWIGVRLGLLACGEPVGLRTGSGTAHLRVGRISPGWREEDLLRAEPGVLTSLLTNEPAQVSRAGDEQDGGW